jgi:hypothetical protein
MILELLKVLVDITANITFVISRREKIDAIEWVQQQSSLIYIGYDWNNWAVCTLLIAVNYLCSANTKLNKVKHSLEMMWYDLLFALYNHHSKH